MKSISVFATTSLLALLACGDPAAPADAQNLSTEPAAEYTPTVHGQALAAFGEIVAHAPSNEELSFLHQYVVNHPVAGLQHIAEYDPQGIVGFCFGRAMAVHLSAARMQIAQDRIGKLFIVGDLRSGENPEWRFHVTTIIKNNTDQWMAVDPILPTAMPVEKWIATVKSVWDKDNKAYLYKTSSDAVLPDLHTFPTPDKENGIHIIELAFNPQNHRSEGFSPLTSFAEMAYELSEDATKKYFSTVRDTSSEASFNFSEIRINESVFSYNNYFLNLTQSLLDVARLIPQSAETPVAMAAALPHSVISNPNTVTPDLRSPRLSGLSR